MAYGFRKINKDGKHYEFTWPLEVGATAICPDWDPSAKCGNGLHLLTPEHCAFDLLDGYYWAVCEYDPETAVIINDNKIKVPGCKIVFLSNSTDGILEFFPSDQITSRWAYYWARDIGDIDHMMQFVTDSEHAYWWARDIGDVEHMKQFVTNSEYAYWWARYIGDRDHMKQFVTESEYVYMWNHAFPDNQIEVK